ncbi:hypothetical protein [Oryza sativa Japonica Group]|uniref:Uncharacterized protein P0510F03.33 n=1 Tax=Oryza sativa subsp. japonica TaxID=39947 RepID=Q9LGP5_ORYSJ|nr:hypothetical protein [Oryza sativa Japonica Group]
MRSHLILSRNSVAPPPSRARATHAHSAPRASPPLHRTSTVVVLCCRLHSVPPPQGAVVEPISRYWLVLLRSGVEFVGRCFGGLWEPGTAAARATEGTSPDEGSDERSGTGRLRAQPQVPKQRD